MSALFKRRVAGGDLLREPTETIISANTIVGGGLRSAYSIRIDGQVLGSVHAEGTVIVGPDGTVDGDITAYSAHIAGRVRGQTRVGDLLEIAATGQLFGDVDVARLAIQDGALFRGQVLMRDPVDAEDGLESSI
jgi:cytoskeletal protein CcmA (bactofilin family)